MDEQKFDEIKFKINSKNVTIITEAVDILIRAITKIIENHNKSGNLENYLQLLQDNCSSEDPKISSTACHGLLTLLEDGLLDTEKTLALTTSMLLGMKNYSGITSIITQILTLNVLGEIGENGNYQSKWKLSVPIHPFVNILQRHPDSIQNVYDEMVLICSPTSSIHDCCIELLRPVFIYILCNPEDKTPSFYKLEILRLIISLKNTPHSEKLLLECLMMQQISTKYMDAYEMYTVVAESAISTSNINLLIVILPILAIICEELTLHGKNPIKCFKLMRKLLDYNEKLILSEKIERCYIEIISNYTLGLLARVIMICPVAYMLELVKLCHQLSKHAFHDIAKGMIICAVLQWEFNKNALTKGFESELNILLNDLKNIKTSEKIIDLNKFQNSLFDIYKKINKKIYLITKQYELYDLIKENKEKTELWISSLKECRNLNVKCDSFLFLQSILVTNLNSESFDLCKIFELTIDITNLNQHLMIGHLPVILYCLHFSQKSEQTLNYLYGIPAMAGVKENIPIVVDVLKRLECNKMISKSFLINLCLKLVEKQSRCFPFLQTLLIKADNCEIDKKWELLTAKANAIKYICETRASSCGIQVVPILSEILTHSTSDECSAACSLALKAIGALWKAEVIDPISTWQVLGSKFHSEKRSLVNVGICNLLALVPSLYYDSPEYDDFIHTAIVKLWKCVTDFDDESVNSAAFDALSKFDLKHMTMRQFPDIYKSGVKLPSNFSKLSCEVSQTIDDITYIPSNVWGNLFKHSKISALSGVSKLCQILIDREVSSYHGGMYNVASEPDNLKHLPSASVVKGIIEYIRKEAKTGTVNPNMAECFKCLSATFGKPLPPINWIFLAAVLKLSNASLHSTKVSILKLLSRQAEVSQSATKVISEYLEFIKTEFQIFEIEVFAEIMPDIVNCAKPVLFLSTLETSLNISYSMTIADDEKPETSREESCKNNILFCNLLRGIKRCLCDETTSEASKKELSGLVCRFYDTIKFENELWIPYADVCREVIEEDLSKLLLRHKNKADYLRSKMALESEPEIGLSFLDEIISCGAESGGRSRSILPLVKTVVSKLNDDLLIQSWMLKMLNDIQKMSSGRTRESVEFMFEIFVESAIAISGIGAYEASADSLTTSLPRAVDYLFAERVGGVLKNLGSRIVEWAHAYAQNDGLSPFSEALELTVIAHCAGESLVDARLWPKYAGSVSLRLT